MSELPDSSLRFGCGTNKRGDTSNMLGHVSLRQPKSFRMAVHKSLSCKACCKLSVLWVQGLSGGTKQSRCTDDLPNPASCVSVCTQRLPWEFKLYMLSRSTLIAKGIGNALADLYRVCHNPRLYFGLTCSNLSMRSQVKKTSLDQSLTLLLCFPL